MKLALLGVNRHALKLVRAIAASDQHQLVAVYDVERNVEELTKLAPLATRDDQWESLLLGTVADAVVVAGRPQDEARMDQLRKLVQAAVPLLVIHPACQALVGYELEMIRRDSGGVLVPFIPGSLHPAWRSAKQFVDQAGWSPQGSIEQLVVERAMEQRTRDNVLAQLACDVQFVRFLLGEVKRVSAMGGTASEWSYANLSVHMQGAAEVLARWSVGPAGQQPAAKLTLLGSAGKLTLYMPTSERDWKLELSGIEHQQQTFEQWDEHRQALQQLSEAIAGTPPQPSWPDACRDLEIAEAVQQSVRRARTVEIFDEEHSEQQTFKAVMAIGGCGVLVGALLLLLGLAVFEGLALPFGEPSAGGATGEHSTRVHFLLRLWPFYPFALFLLLQLLRLLIPSDKPRRQTASGDVDGSTLTE